MVKFSETNLAIKQPNYKEFGKFMINVLFLEDNILLVKYKSYSPVPSLRRMTISNDFKTLVTYLFDTGEISYAIAQKLKQSEKEVFDNLIKKSGLRVQLKYNPERLDDDLDSIINEFEILKGEVIAGNDNPKIIKDIKAILLKLVKLGKVSQETATEILAEL